MCFKQLFGLFGDDTPAPPPVPQPTPPPQPSKAPAIAVSRASNAAAGTAGNSSTLLTGPSGVSSDMLSLGKSTLLGR